MTKKEKLNLSMTGIGRFSRCPTEEGIIGNFRKLKLFKIQFQNDNFDRTILKFRLLSDNPTGLIRTHKITAF